MKKLLLLFILLLSFSTYGIAQSNYIEVVYLKNGSIIRGIVIEQVPNVSLKVKTADGSIFAYPMEDVVKITKEEDNRHSNKKSYSPDNTSGTLRPKSSLRGYAGFVNAGYIFDTSDYDMNRVEVSTSHGYQFNNHIFLGGGIALNYNTDQDTYAVPVFTNFKVNFLKTKVTPFADVKLGYTISEWGGVYSSMALGVRFSLTKKQAVNLRLEYVYQGGDHEYTYYGSSFNYHYTETIGSNGIGLKVGVEF